MRYNFYVYAEMLKPGKSHRPVKVVKKLKRFTNTSAMVPERARIKALEKAVKFACDMVSKLEREKTPYARVFISSIRDTIKATHDVDAFEYSGPNGQELGPRVLW